MKISILISLVFFICASTSGQSPETDSKPGDLFNILTRNPAFKENFAGEPWAWHATNNGSLFVEAYEVWKDTAWLNWGIRYYGFLLSHMQAGPDGYLGLIGPNFGDNGLWSDEEISDALVGNILLEFAELVLKETGLRNKYGKKAREYVAFCKKQLIEKWDKRGQWKEVGVYGDYITTHHFVKPNDFSKWVMDEKTQRFPRISLQYNKANCLAITNLRLYRITGDPFYRAKAEKLFFRIKRDFQLFNDHYVWNYWSPFYENDILSDSNRCRHWVGVHPYRPGYQQWEVAQMVEAYHTGVVFDSADMRRLINTNLDVMWNRNLTKPEFILSTGKHPDPSDRNAENAIAGRGILWSALGDFSQTVLDLVRQEKENQEPARDITEVIHLAYLDSIVLRKKPGFRRNYAEGRPVIVRNTPLGNSPDLNDVGVIPYLIKRGRPAFVIAKSASSGNLVVELFTRDGKTRIRTIDQGPLIGDGDGLKGFRIIKWDGTDPEREKVFKGDYLIRWTLNGKFRDYAIEIY